MSGASKNTLYLRSSRCSTRFPGIGVRVFSRSASSNPRAWLTAKRTPATVSTHRTTTPMYGSARTEGWILDWMDSVARLRQAYERFNTTGEFEWDLLDPDVEW